MRKRIRRRGARKGKPRGTKGRNPTGLQPGERLSDYPRLTVRVPQETVDRLRALADAEGVPQWRILHAAIQAYTMSRES
jgi:Ribbon-helix-helix protein, copG family